MNDSELISRMDIKSLLAKLIAYPSITPEDKGCQAFMQVYLEGLGFSCQNLDNAPVSNFFAQYGNSGPLLVFAGHTDVVAAGDRSLWLTDPFVLVEKDGLLFGRGVADMKGSLASMLRAAAAFVQQYPNFPGRLGFLITSGEEGDDFDLGTPYVMEQLQSQGIAIDYCVVGEPSSTAQAGDVIKVGRRGSLSARISLQGKQGHVAYAHLANNPIHKISPLLASLCARVWDLGNKHFPPTSMQITSIEAGGAGGNVIPGLVTLCLNFRFSTEQTDQSLRLALENLLREHDLSPTIEWRLNGQPFLTDTGILVNACKQVILEKTGLNTELSTSGGTSDARFIAPYGVEVVELGPVNASIHQVNECVSWQDLESLESIYFALCENLLL